MPAVHRFWMAGSLVVLCVIGCDRREPLAPDIQAASGGGSGPNVNAPSGTNVVAVSYSAINISWRDNSSNETGFEVHRSTSGASGPFNLLVSLGPNATSYSDGGLTGSSQYCYQVRAFRTTGNKKSYSAFSSTACATTPAAPLPLAPSGVNVTPLYSYLISVTWTDNSSDENGFRVERSINGGPWTNVNTTSANVASFNDYQFPGDEQLACYRVVAFNSFGNSAPSSVDCTSPPAAPTNLAGTPVGGSAVDLTWTDNSAVEDGFEVQRAGGGADWSIIATLPANTTVYRDAAVTPDNTYWYVVRATKDGGSSSNPSAVQVVVATTPPVAPSSMNVTPSSSSSVYGLWFDQSTNEAGFRVERSIDGGASWVTAATTATDEYWFYDQGLSGEQPVCYRVIAFNSVGESLPSDMDCTTPPAAPTDLTATGIDAVTADLAWSDNSAAEDGYEVWVDDGYSDFYPIATLGPNTTTYRVNDGYAYYYGYYVVATKDGGYSDWSHGTYATPPAGAGSSALRRGSMSRMQTPPRPPVRRRGP